MSEEAVTDGNETPSTLLMELDASHLGDEQFNEIVHHSIRPIANLKRMETEQKDDSARSIRLFMLGDLAAFHMRDENLLFVRGRKHIASGDLDNFYLYSLHNKGRHSIETNKQTVYETRDSKQAVLETGDSLLSDLAQPFSGHVLSKVDSYHFVIPKQALHQHSPSMKASEWLHLSGATPAGAMLRNAVYGLGHSLGNTTPEQAQAAANALSGLISHLMAPGSHSEDSPVMRSATMAAMMEYIDQHLHDHTLGVNSLVQAFHRSRATVYRLFAGEGGVVAYIQRRRLHACYQELTLNPSRSKRIIDIALKWGFSNHSHFSYAFREAYGLTPSSVHEAAMELELESVNGQARTYAEEQNRIRQWMFNSC